MKLVSLNCPNCNAPVRQDGDRKYICDNCGSVFLLDYDQNDVEYLKLQSEADKADSGNNDYTGSGAYIPNNNVKPRRKPVLAIFLIFFIFFMMTGGAFSLFQFQLFNYAGNTFESLQSVHDQLTGESSDDGINFFGDNDKKELTEEEKQKALIASYHLKPEDLLSDKFFVKNAKSALLSQLRNNTNLYYTNWKWKKGPKYLKSYLLTAKDDENDVHNILINIYKVHWDKVYDDRTEHYIMYDGTCLKNLSKDQDGTIKSDYDTDEMSMNNELVANQFLSGYSDLKQLIRKEIYGKNEYIYKSFKFPGSGKSGSSSSSGKKGKKSTGKSSGKKTKKSKKSKR